MKLFTSAICGVISTLIYLIFAVILDEIISPIYSNPTALLIGGAVNYYLQCRVFSGKLGIVSGVNT